MLRTFYLDVKDATRTINRFEVRFALDQEAVEHSKQLAASLRHRDFNNHLGLTIVVLDQSSRTNMKKWSIPRASKNSCPPHIANNRMPIAPTAKASVAARDSAYVQSCPAMEIVHPRHLGIMIWIQASPDICCPVPSLSA
jgi:hypothetical protein